MSSESGSTGLLENQWRLSGRTGPACHTCRQRKTRCALSTQPEGGPCEYCESVGIACSLTPKLLGPPRTYVESLELRLQVTQDLLRNLSTSAGVDLVALANRSAEPAGSQELQQAIETLRQQEGSDKAAATEEQTPTPPTTSYNPNNVHLQGVYDNRFAGKTAPQSFANEILHDYVDGVHLTAAGEQQSLVDHLIAGSSDRPTSFNYPLPPAEILQLLIDSFFSNFNDQLPLLHRPSFDRALLAGEANSDASFRSLLFIVLAVGARWVKSLRAQGGEWTPKALFTSSCSYTDMRVFSTDAPTVYDLQSAALVVVHLLGAEHSPCAWSAAGIGLRKLVDVGAHLETSERWTRSPLEDQLRKRAFHCLYVLDRFISASLGRPVAIQDEDFDLSYPLAIQDIALDQWKTNPLNPPSPAPSSVETLERLARLARIQGKVLKRTHVLRSCPQPAQEMWPVVQELKAELDEWLTSLPPHLSWSFAGAGSKTTLAARGQLRALFHAVQLALVGPFILAVVKARDSSLSHLSECFQVNMLAVWTWSEIMAKLVEMGQIDRCFYWVPINAGFPCLVALHTLRGQLIGGRYLFRVAESLQTSIRALQLLKDSTPEADWTFQSCKKLASYVNGWRPSDGFDYETFLLSPSTAPAELYLSLPPFASTSEDTQVVSLHPDVSTDQLAFSQPIESSFLDISTTQLDIFASFLAEDSSLFSQETLGFSHALAEGGAKWPEDWAWREWQGR